jgi:DNA-binding NarL/FixJ family response regulator
MAAPRILLADPNALVRSLLRVALEKASVVIVAETDSLQGLLELAGDERPDVIVTNSDLDGGAIDASVAGLIAAGSRVLVITRDPSPERLTYLLEFGVSGYLLREVEPAGVVEAVLAVARGDAALHPVAASTVLDQWRRLRSSGALPHNGNERSTLTPRELDVLGAMADGLSTKAIARRLGVAVKTVENHKTRVFDKLGVRTQAHAVAIAIGQGMLAQEREHVGERV